MMQSAIAIALDVVNRNCNNWPMDWKTIIAEIQEHGLSQAEIGKRLNKSQPWVVDVLKGRYGDLKWSDGEALRGLHESVCEPRKGRKPHPKGRPLVDHSHKKAA